MLAAILHVVGLTYSVTDIKYEHFDPLTRDLTAEEIGRLGGAEFERTAAAVKEFKRRRRRRRRRSRRKLLFYTDDDDYWGDDDDYWGNDDAGSHTL